MEYTLLIYANETGFQSMTETQVAQALSAYAAYGEALRKAGAYVASNRLRPSASSTTVRMAEGKSEVLNGPYAETREQLGGYYLIDVPDLDAALSWAARCPGASHGTVAADGGAAPHDRRRAPAAKRGRRGRAPAAAGRTRRRRRRRSADSR
jgi:hypothetical protein